MIGQLALTLTLATAAPAGAAELRWPLEFDDGLSASFGELRDDRLHTGIDLRTRGEVGHPVHAVAAGRVIRLQERWRGYGLAVYIEHPGGLVTVYGHLDRVVPELEAALARRRKARNSRWADDVTLDRPFAVERGAVFAWAGESGAGMPHLHFETRRGMGTPVDPFTVGLVPPADPTPAVIEQLIVEPAGAGATVDGGREAVAYDVIGDAGSYSIGRPVTLTGPVHLLLRAFDRVGAENHTGIGGMTARIDDDLWRQVDLAAIPFTANQTAGVLLDLGRSHLGPSFYTYRISGLPGAGVPYSRGRDGAVTLAPGRHRLEVELRDAVTAITKARTRLTLELVVEANPATIASTSGDRTLEVDAIDLAPLGSLLRLATRTHAAAATSPVIELAGRVIPLVARGAGLWDAEIEPPAGEVLATGGGQNRRFAVSSADRGRATTTRLGPFVLTLPADAPWGPVNIVARRVPAAVPDGLQLRSDAIALSPDGHPFRQPGVVSFEVTGGPRSGVYQLDSTDGSWSAVDFGTSAEVRRLGTYALIDDLAKPVIETIRTEPPRLKAGVVTLVAKVADVGSGIPELGVHMRIDERDLDVRFDPDRHEAAARWVAKAGEHHLRVRLTDWVGNSAERSVTLVVP